MRQSLETLFVSSVFVFCFEENLMVLRNVLCYYTELIFICQILSSEIWNELTIHSCPSFQSNMKLENITSKSLPFKIKHIQFGISR